jgi:CheY-like chemotaxis protein
MAGPPAAEVCISPHPRARHILIVEPDAAFRELLQRVASDLVSTDSVGDFQSAYARLSTSAPDLLVANLRLNANVEGLHLAYVVASAGYATRTLVYSERVELWVTRELQRAGAFYENQSRIVYALPSYVEADLPVLDRRTAGASDRRAAFRGGRRSSDVPIASPDVYDLILPDSNGRSSV